MTIENLTPDAEPVWVTIRQPKRVSWEPQPDITAYEMAQAITGIMRLFGHYPEDYIMSMDPSVRRHFRIEVVK